MHKYIKSSFKRQSKSKNNDIYFVGVFGIVMLSTYIYGKISFNRKYRNEIPYDIDDYSD